MVFAFRTAAGFWGSVRAGRIAPPSANASSDGLLQPVLRISHPSEQLTQAFARLPPDARLLFVSPKGDERWDFVYSAVCYLSWPRKVERFELLPNQRFTSPASFNVATMFCGTVAPAAGERLSLGPNLILVPPQAGQ
jgi:hypothetical protein